MAGKQKPESNTRAKEETGQSLGLLWAGVLIAPLALLSHMQVNYTLTQKLCPGGRTLLLHLVTMLFLLVTAIGSLIAWACWRRAGKGLPDESGDKQTINRFLGVVGLMISALSFLVIIAQWIPQFIFNPCQR